MNEPHDLNQTIDIASVPADSLAAGLAAGFAGPRSSLGDMRPPLLKEAEGESAHIVQPKSDAMPPPEQTGDRYQLQGEIARGGMGAVLRGRDVDLGRDLAVKVLLEKHAHRPEVARRFIEEAQIGGQLQHPGVVPVYDIGRFGERPFFTMKLVKGKTLAALLAERNWVARPEHGCEGRGEHPQTEHALRIHAQSVPPDLPRFLAIALQVAQTLAYAHAKGVIHRDLKPANIMVGTFGEVQVMDWGLAKVLAEGGIADEERASREPERPEDVTTIRTARNSSSTGSFGSDTEAGALLGTPAYMPPEQANGDVANLDRRADVFGLGAILCEILTGKAPYVGRSAEEVRRKAANGDLADALARLNTCGADAELIALTKTCLAAEGIDRPKDAQEVAERLSSYLNGVQERLQAAERERAVAVAREAEQRKRRKVQLALAAALLGLLLGGGAFAWWRNEEAQAGRERDARNAEAVAALLGQAEDALVAGDAAKAEVALEAARKRSDEGGAEQEAERLSGLDADLTLVRDLDRIDQFRWTVSENKVPNEAAVAARTREALARFDPEKVSVDDARARLSASVVMERIVSALDRLLLPVRLVDVAKLPLEEQKRYTPQRRADVAAQLPKTAAVRALLRQLDPDPYRDAVRDAVLAEDRAKFVKLADQPAALKQPPGFTAFLGESQAIEVQRRRDLLQAALSSRPGNLALLMTLGGTYPLNQQETANERLRWYQAAVAAFPAMPAAHNALGIALGDKKDLAGAEAAFRKAIELDAKYAVSHGNLAVTLSRKGQVDEAIACCRKAIELDPKLSGPHNSLGAELCDRKHDYDGAIACFRKAIELDPNIAMVHKNLGNALKGKGLLAEAIACYRKAIELDPTLATAHVSLAEALTKKGQVDEAIACYTKAIELDPKLAAAHSNLGAVFCDVKRDYEAAIACFTKAIELDPKDAVVHDNLGNALTHKGRLDEAIASYKKAIELAPNYAVAHVNLGTLLRDKGQVDEAIACYTKAIEVNPKVAGVHFNLGSVLYNKGQVDEAIACYQQAIEVAPKHAEAHCNLGNALSRQGRFTESLEAFKRGHELGSKQPGWPYPSAEWVRQAEKRAAMESRLPAFLQGQFQPRGTAEFLGLAEVCEGKKLHTAAARLYAEAFAADPKLTDDPKAGHRYNAACYAALAAASQGKDVPKLDDKERTHLRKQALDWLRADLALYARHLESGPPAARPFVRHKMSHWQEDSDLAGIRDAAALARLSAEERVACERLWADVAALLKSAGAKGNQDQQSAEPGKLGQTLQPQGGKNGTDKQGDDKQGADKQGAHKQVTDKQVSEQGDDEAAKAKLATEYLKAGKKDQALPLLVEIWNMKKARLGPDHPDTLQSMNQLGVVYWQLGQLDKSVPLFEKLLKIREAKLGRDHIETLQAVANLGVNYKDAGKLKEAIRLLEEALRAARKNPQLGWVVNPALDAYTRAGENAKVANLLQEVLPAIRKGLPADSPQLAGLLAQGGMALLNLKKWAEAEPLLRECLTIREKAQPDVWMTFNTKSMLGGVLLGQKQYADAEPLLLAGYEGMKKRRETIPPQGQSRLVEAALRLVQLYEALGKQDEVARWSREREALEAPVKNSKKKNAKERKP